MDTSKKRSSGIRNCFIACAEASAPGLVKPTALTKQPGAYWLYTGSRFPVRGVGPTLFVVITPICGI